MKKKSRVSSTLMNFISSLGGQLLGIVLQFAVRTVFIRTLGSEYLGINGLFSNILSMLSMAEMGLGSAIIFKLYAPIEVGDQNRIAVLMKFYKTMYRYIGLVIAALGILMIPFLPLLIADYDRLASLNLNAVFIYALYLFNSVASYLFFAYKSAIIRANQDEYRINLMEYFCTTILSVMQIVALCLFKRFELYVILLVAKTIVQNVLVARMADKSYPYLRHETKNTLSKQETKAIFKDCGALFIYKINGVVLNATDNILLSVFWGLGQVGLYSNYLVFYTTINGFFSRIYNAVTHSLGSLHASRNHTHEYEVFEAVILITAILGGTGCVGVALVGDELIRAWIGAEWIIPQPFACLLGLELFVSAFKCAFGRYRSAMGLFRQAKFRPVAGMIINLAVSLALVKHLGISGVVLGTIVSDWLTFIWYDPLIVHKHGFKDTASVWKYYGKFAKYIVAMLAAGVLNYWLCSIVLTNAGWVSVAAHIVICGVTTPVVILLSACTSKEAEYVLQLAGKYLGGIGRKIRHQ